MPPYPCPRLLLVRPGDKDAQHRRVDRPRADRVDPNVFRRQALRQRADKPDNAELRHRIDRAERRALSPEVEAV